jgi:hypothetical protein
MSEFKPKKDDQHQHKLPEVFGEVRPVPQLAIERANE